MTFFNAVKKYWYIIASIVVVVTIASFVVSIIQTPEYKSSVQLLVIQKQQDNADAYTATRSAETVAEILSNVIFTSTFFDQTMSSGFEIDKNTYSTDLEERKKEWEKAIDARVIGDNGTMQIDVYDKNRNQSEQLAYAIAYVIINNGKQYHGAATQIETKLIDAPITTDKIARPNITLNVLAGFVLGLMTSLAVIFLLSERKPKEKYVANLEVKTMPKIKNNNRRIFKKANSSVAKNNNKKPVRFNSRSLKVKERIASELKDYKKSASSMNSLDIKEREIKTKKPGVNMSEAVSSKTIKNKLSAGMDSIKVNTDSVDETAPNDKIVYTPEDIQENYKKIEDDKYSPDKVEKWIKTGKFE